MAFFGVMAFILCLYYGDKVGKLNRQVKKLEKQGKGANQMSAIFKELVNQSVKLEMDALINTTEPWTILSVDEDWVKIQRTDKKGQVLTKIVRLDDIKSVELV